MSMFKSREEMTKMAEELGLEISFDNPPDKSGVWIGDKKIAFEEVFAPFLTIEDDE